MKRLLILGGTRFMGRHLATLAVETGYEVTLFHRGTTNPDAVPGAEHVLGDRDGGLDALRGRTWTAAVDMCGYYPRLVRDAASLLADAVEHYTFISSISAYASAREPDQDESAPLGVLSDPEVEEITETTYGPLKAACERAAEAAMPGRVLVIRPGLIVGPFDPTDRFTYWVERTARGGEVLVPEPADRPVQVIDARDLAAWTLRMVERRALGAYNATGPAEPHTMREVVETGRAVAGSDARFTWVSETFLVERKVGPWMELPLWIPGGDDAGLMRMNVAKALAAELRPRPLADTMRDTLAWARTLPADRVPGAGLSPERERELLRAWRGGGK